MARKPMHTWIDEAMRDPDKDGDISAIALIHMTGLQQRELHITKFSKGKAWTAKDLADMFRSKAETYCQDLPGVNTFNLLAFYGGRNQPEAHYPFTVNSIAENVNGQLVTEPPTSEGKAMQAMRQGEAVFQQVWKRQQQQDEFGLKFMEAQNRMLVDAMHENREMFNIMKEMMMSAALKNHEYRMQEMNYQRTSEMQKKFMTFVPPLVNTILGKEVFPQSTEDTALIESIAESLTEEDVMKVASVVKPELLGPLMARVEKALVKKRKADEHDAQVAGILQASNARSNPEDNAAGD